MGARGALSMLPMLRCSMMRYSAAARPEVRHDWPRRSIRSRITSSPPLSRPGCRCHTGGLSDRPGACPSSITARRQRQSTHQAPDRAQPVHSRHVPKWPLLQCHPHLANLPRKRTDKAAEPVGARSEILPRSLLPQAPGQSPSKTLARAPCDRREHGSGCWAGATVGPAGS
jgi:hypothetical protein